MFQANQEIGLYTLVRQIGYGGFGEVWLAERRTELLTTLVAIKLPHRGQVDLEAIRQEAQLWGKASGHANVLPIIEANIYDGQIVIVSEFAPDGSLEEKLHREEGIPVKQTVETVIGILNGLEFLHSRQIIHRDIKPANILLQGETPRLADFGISRVIKTTVLSTSIVGTPKYMAPEAFDGKRSAETDIWSVGVILYQMLLGKLPFPQENPTELMWAIVSKEPQPLPDSIPPDLRKIINKALAKLPENRFRTAKEMREELQKAWLNISHPTFAPTEVLEKPISKDDNLTIEDKSMVATFPKTGIPPTVEEPKDSAPVPLVNKTANQNQPPANIPAEYHPILPVVSSESQLQEKPTPTVPQETAITSEQTPKRAFHWGFYFLPFLLDFIVRPITFSLGDILAKEDLVNISSFWNLILLVKLPLEVVIYGILGALLGLIFPQGKWKWGLLLNIEFLGIVILGAPRHQWLALLFLGLMTTITACLTSYLGSGLSPRKPENQSVDALSQEKFNRPARWICYFLAPVIGLIINLNLDHISYSLLSALESSGILRIIPLLFGNSLFLLKITVAFIDLGVIAAILGYSFPQEKWRWGLWLNVGNLIWLVSSFFIRGNLSIISNSPGIFSYLSILTIPFLTSYLGSRLSPQKSDKNSITTPKAAWTTARIGRWVFYFLAPVVGTMTDLLIGNIAHKLVAFLIYSIYGVRSATTIEVLASIPFLLILYGIFGVLLGYIFPQEKWRWGLWLNILSFIFIINLFIVRGCCSFYDDTDNLWDDHKFLAFLEVIKLLSIIITSCFASYLGSWLAWRKTENPA